MLLLLTRLGEIMRLFVITAVTLLTGCASTGYVSTTGGALFQSTVEGLTVGGTADTSKRGVSCAKNYLGIIAAGDSSIEAAKRSAGIRDVATVDRHFHNILGLYGQVCTVVHGK